MSFFNNANSYIDMAKDMAGLYKSTKDLFDTEDTDMYPNGLKYSNILLSSLDDLPPPVENSPFTNARDYYLDMLSRSFGSGAYFDQIHTNLKYLDRFDNNTLPPNAAHAGLTFITRPRLCLCNSALYKRSEFVPLLVNDPTSIQSCVREMLDTKYARSPENKFPSKLVDNSNPFAVPLCNNLVGISGWPDWVVDTKTTDAGFFSEDQTYAVGSDMLNKSYDLTLNFKDPQYGPVAAIFFYWIMYIAMVTRGLMPAYAEDIQQLRLNYTVSIYRFMLDPTKRYIVQYSKATGCFPKSHPIGSMFDFSDSEKFVRTAGNFSIYFTANKIEYNKPEILNDFNTLVRRYHDRQNGTFIEQKPDIPYDANFNYIGVPYIKDFSKGKSVSQLELVFR